MRKLALCLTKKFIEKEIIDSKKSEIYITGLELIFSDIINVVLIFVFCIFTQSILYGIIYISMLYAVRRFSGGFHAKKYWTCRLVTVGTYIIIFLLSNCIIHNKFIYVSIINLTAVLAMIIFAPIKHPNKILKNAEVRANKIFSIIATVLFALISIFLILVEREEGLIISLTLLAIEILMYIGLLVNKKGGELNEKL